MPHAAVIAQCPYFERENQVTIYCESTMKMGGYYAHIFHSNAEKSRYMREHCSKYPHMGCKYAEYIDSYYGGRENDSIGEIEKNSAGK